MGLIIKEVKKIDYVTIGMEYLKERAKFAKDKFESPCYKIDLTSEEAFNVYKKSIALERDAFYSEICMYWKQLNMDCPKEQAKAVIAYALLTDITTAKWLAKQLDNSNVFVHNFFEQDASEIKPQATKKMTARDEINLLADLIKENISVFTLSCANLKRGESVVAFLEGGELKAKVMIGRHSLGLITYVFSGKHKSERAFKNSLYEQKNIHLLSSPC